MRSGYALLARRLRSMPRELRCASAGYPEPWANREENASGLTQSPSLFLDSPSELSDLRRASPLSYWRGTSLRPLPTIILQLRVAPESPIVAPSLSSSTSPLSMHTHHTLPSRTHRPAVHTHTHGLQCTPYTARSGSPLDATKLRAAPRVALARRR